MAIEEFDIDWDYLLERLERFLDLGEEYLRERLVEEPGESPAPEMTTAFRWVSEGRRGWLQGVAYPDLPDHADLLGIDRVLAILHRNTRQFLHGFSANNVLLWGERGTGKSSAVKGLLAPYAEQGLRLVEVHKEDLYHLPAICTRLRAFPQRFILFCDDLSFDESEVSYRELKALLEGGVEARPDNVLVYATSNRRHLMPERLLENTDAEEIHPEERVAEKLSLSDRFGITLAFYCMSQDTYLAIVRHLARQRNLSVETADLERRALLWARGRGARSGRVARQFIDDLGGRLALQAVDSSAAPGPGEMMDTENPPTLPNKSPSNNGL
jgi:predicted AAA+ superfamily ATPase